MPFTQDSAIYSPALRCTQAELEPGSTRDRLEELFPQLVLTAYKFKDGTTYTKIYFSCRSVSLIKSEHYGPCGRQKSRPGAGSQSTLPSRTAFHSAVRASATCQPWVPDTWLSILGRPLLRPVRRWEVSSSVQSGVAGAGAALPGRPGHTRGSPHLRAGGPQGRSS